jgi:hypothetical protein
MTDKEVRRHLGLREAFAKRLGQVVHRRLLRRVRDLLREQVQVLARVRQVGLGVQFPARTA